MRIVSLLPSATEIVYALGLGDNLCGVSHECDYPTEAKNKPVVVKSLFDNQTLSSVEIDRLVVQNLRNGGTIYKLDMEAFKAARPDLVITQKLCDVCAVAYDEVSRAVDSLPKKPQVISLDPNLIEDVLSDIMRIGELTDRLEEARQVVSGLQQRIGLLKSKASEAKEKPKVLCLEWLDPIMTSGHWVPQMVEYAGGLELLGRKGSPSARQDWMKVLDYQPEIIIVMPCGFDVTRSVRETELLKARPGWRDLPAVRNRRIYAVNGHAFYSRSGPRLVDGLEIMGKMIHPEIFGQDLPEQGARWLPQPGSP